MLDYSARGRIGAIALLALGATLLAVAACQLIAGTETRQANPELGGCALPSGAATQPQVRIANFVPDSSVVDVCIRPAGETWGEPLVLNGGTDCNKPTYFGASAPPGYKGPPGFAYGQVSVPFIAPAPVVDVKMVAAGKSCNDSALTEADHLKLLLPGDAGPNAPAVTTLLRIGGAAGVAEKIEALPENYPPNETNAFVRFVNVMPGVGPVDFGVAPPGATQLPTTVAQNIVQPIGFGQVAPAMINGMPQTALTGNAVTDNGYIPIIAGSYSIVAGVHDGTMPEKAVLFENLAQNNGASFSLYAAGLPRNDQYPQDGYFCTENGPQTQRGNPLLAPCAQTKLPSISVDVFTTGLYGPNSAAYLSRKAAITDRTNSPIQKRDSDIMCLSEMDFVPDIQQIIANALPPDAGGTGSFPYNYWVQTNITTPFTDGGLTQDGAMPPPPSIPCANVPTTPTPYVKNAYDCMISKCSTMPGQPTGTLPATTDCLTQNCPGPLGTLLLNPAYNACFDCIIDYAASDQPYNTGQTACTTAPQQPFGFNGQLSNVILSRYPLTDTDYYILPSTNYRQGILYAKVQLEDQSFDFYCAFLTSTLVGNDLPYTGNYGAGGNPTSEGSGGGYANEQILQAQRLIDWVHYKSGNNPAMVVGDWRASPQGPADAGPSNPEAGIFTSPTALVPETLSVLGHANGFTAVSAPDWTPQCTYCPQGDNALNAGNANAYFMVQPYLYNWPMGPLAAQEESLIYTQPSPEVTYNGASAPISPYFGLNIQISRPK